MIIMQISICLLIMQITISLIIMQITICMINCLDYHLSNHHANIIQLANIYPHAQF